ncbi:MAG: hypothetical protein ACPIOQ_05935, partial [Promethearchaeia archaeon]
MSEPVHHRPVGPAATKVSSARDSTVRVPHIPMAYPVRAARAHPRVCICPRGGGAHRLLPPLASPAGGQGTARSRPSKPEAELIFVVLLVRSRGGTSSRVSPAMWQPIGAGARSAQGACACGGCAPSTGVATAEPSAPAAAMRTRFVSNDAEPRQPEAGIEGDDPGQDAPGDDADGQACSTASAMAEPSAVVAEARARIDDRMCALSPACPYRAEIARWLRDQWPPGAEVVPRLPTYAAEIAKRPVSNATWMHKSVVEDMKSCRAKLLKIREAARKRGAKEVARKRGEKEVARKRGEKEVARSADRSANRPRSGHNVAAARAVSSGIPASGRRFSGPGNPKCDCGESESCGCYPQLCRLLRRALVRASAAALAIALACCHPSPRAPTRRRPFRQRQYVAAKASNTESLLTSNDDLPAYVDQHVRVSTRDKERLLCAWRDVMDIPLAACAACGVRAPPELPCGSVLRVDGTDASASDEDEEAQLQTLDFEVVRERGRLGFLYRSDNVITRVTNSTSGLVEGDVVIAVDGINVTAGQGAHALIDDRPLQDRYRIRVERGRHPRPSPEEAAAQPVRQ